MNKSNVKRWFPILLIVIFFVAAWISGFVDMFNLETVKAYSEQLIDTVYMHPIISVIVFIVFYALTVALSLPVATVLTLLSGYLFGRWLGTVVVVVGATSGATVIFLISRSALGGTLREKAGPFYDKVSENMKNNAVSYMLFMRLVPLFPFFLVNILPALFNVRLFPYFLTTMIGVIPGTFVYVNVGQELGSIETLSDLVSSEMLAAFVLLGLFALLPILYKLKKKGTVNKNDGCVLIDENARY